MIGEPVKQSAPLTGAPVKQSAKLRGEPVKQSAKLRGEPVEQPAHLGGALVMNNCGSAAGREDLFEEELDAVAVAEELAPLTLQLALVHGRLGRHAEAREAYEVGAGPIC